MRVYDVLKKEYDKLFVFFELLFNNLAVKERLERERKERLVELFNELFKALDISYAEFNTVIWMETEEQKEKLKVLEKQYPELGIKYDGDKVGVSTISLFGTVTGILCGKQFAVRIDNDTGKIIRCGFAKFNDDGGLEIEE